VGLSDYTELHLHDHFSTLDGLNTPDEYMKRAKELGMTHLAQTNHGTLAGHRDFQRAAKSAGIVPILGVEAYISATDRFDKRSKANRDDDTSIYNHIILLAQNETGIKNLNLMSEKAWTEGFYSKPRIDTELLFEYNEGIIVLSGCMNGLISRAIENGDLFYAEQIARQYKDVLGDRFYIEVQGHNPLALNLGLLEIADEVGIRPVATSDCHYARREDLWVEDAILILSTKPKQAKGTDYERSKRYGSMMERFNYLWPERSMTFQDIEIFLRDRKTNQELFHEQGIVREDIYDATMEIANRVEEVSFHQGLELLPIPAGDPDRILSDKAHEGLKRRGLADKPEYVARLQEELDIIKSKRFSSYFLMVEDVVSWAKSVDIPVGPGRGSAAGSLVCYALGITDADPIEYGLLFFRFIDPARDDYPDIDTDFGDLRRGEIKDYLARKYGNVASIATFNRFQGKNALKDAAKVLGVPISDVNKSTKNNDAPTPKDYYFDTFDNSEQGRVFTEKYPEAVDLAKRLYGRIRQIGMHAAGVVVAKEPIQNFAPLQTATDPNDKTGPRLPYIANDMEQVADIGLIKLDILGLKNLTIIDETIKDVKNRHGIDLVMNDLDLADPAVYKMLAAGHTKAVFQAEGGTFTNWILDTKCENFNDLVIGTSIARPGPLNTVGKIYRKRMFGEEPVSYVHEIMEKYTNETMGLIVFQEQVMQAMTELGGMSMSTANKVRKIIGKKRDVSEFEQYKDEFVAGASKHIRKSEAQRLWHEFEAHAGYSFNKSHAVVYSLITYWTAWLKYYYPLEYMAATLRNERDKDSFTDYLIETKRLGLKVYLPHINQSDAKVSIQGDGIRLGLTNIKYVSDGVASKILAARPFRSYAQLLAKAEEKHSGLNSRMIGALNKVGAAQFPDNPLVGDEGDYLYEYLAIPAFKTKNVPPHIASKFRPLEDFEERGVFPVLAMARGIKRGPGWARVDFVDETGDAGIFTHQDTPIETGQMYAMLIADNRIAKYMTVEELSLGINNSFYKWLDEKEHSIPEDRVRVISFKSHTTKAGKKMAYVVVQDDTGQLFHILAFTSMYVKAYSKCQEGALLSVQVAETEDGTLFFKEIS
jgi:DNA polymerase-3 subunit alpha